MCFGCYEEAGSPNIINDDVIFCAKIMGIVEYCGNMHCLIQDWNCEDEQIEDEINRFEERWQQWSSNWEPYYKIATKSLLDRLASMTFEERISALALNDGYIEAPA